PFVVLVHETVVLRCHDHVQTLPPSVDMTRRLEAAHPERPKKRRDERAVRRSHRNRFCCERKLIRQDRIPRGNSVNKHDNETRTEVLGVLAVLHAPASRGYSWSRRCNAQPIWPAPFPQSRRRRIRINRCATT